MKRTQWIALAVVALLGLLVLRVALTNRNPPFLPPDADHATGTTLQQCESCHGPGGDSPKSADHPIGNDCSRCHARR